MDEQVEGEGVDENPIKSDYHGQRGPMEKDGCAAAQAAKRTHCDKMEQGTRTAIPSTQRTGNAEGHMGEHSGRRSSGHGSGKRKRGMLDKTVSGAATSEVREGRQGRSRIKLYLHSI